MTDYDWPALDLRATTAEAEVARMEHDLMSLAMHASLDARVSVTLVARVAAGLGLPWAGCAT